MLLNCVFTRKMILSSIAAKTQFLLLHIAVHCQYVHLGGVMGAIAKPN